MVTGAPEEPLETLARGSDAPEGTGLPVGDEGTGADEGGLVGVVTGGVVMGPGGEPADTATRPSTIMIAANASATTLDPRKAPLSRTLLLCSDVFFTDGLIGFSRQNKRLPYLNITNSPMKDRVPLWLTGYLFAM